MTVSAVTILYTELADYSIACFHALKEQDVNIQLIHWPINPEAPFKFDLSFLDETLERSTLSDQELLRSVRSFQPDLILCSGWMDKGYLKVSSALKADAVTVLSLDNHWTGSFKQQLARIIAPFTLKRSFSKTFVPGEAQRQYALRLGFEEDDIRTGFYSAAVERFVPSYETKRSANEANSPKRFFFLGRYVEHKGIFDLWEAFIHYRKQGGEWELWCAGTGDQYPNRVEHEGIKHLGFVQPYELAPILQQCSVYILPSHFEPWGVSVHEMAVAGFPMLLSDQIGAKEMFLSEGENGSIFQSRNPDSILQKMNWIASKSEEELHAMGKASHDLGMRHTPKHWVEALMSFLD